MAAPPPFQPDPAQLRKMLDTCSTKLDAYEKSKDPGALAALSQSAQQLNDAATHPIDKLFNMAMAPSWFAALQIALPLKLFDKIPQQGSISVTKLQELTPEADPELVLRIVRAIAASGLLNEPETQSYAHTATSPLLPTPAFRAIFEHFTEHVFPALAKFKAFFDANGYKPTQDSKNSPFTFTMGVKNMDVFEYFMTDPRQLEMFNTAMAGVQEMSLKELPSTFVFDKLEVPNGGVALVDVGGGKGQAINTIRASYPSLKGKWILEDLPKVLDGDVVVDKNDVELRPYDFFKEEQPVKGAASYFLKSILHDWPDAECITILRNQIPAFRGHKHSRLLISEVVLEDKSPDTRKVFRDINMLAFGGKERNIKQWTELLGSVGFKILHIHGLGNDGLSIIEAALDE